ncbi:MAG: hypothetical protein ACXVPQ_08655 [Bacteroidia bacterium]
MAIHIGKKIKEEVQKQRFPVTLFAKKINRSRNVVYNIFERESIDTDLLNKIGKVLNCDFFSLYSAQKEYTYDNVKNFVSESGSAYHAMHSEEVKSLKDQVENLKNEVAYLKKINALLEKRQK